MSFVDQDQRAYLEARDRSAKDLLVYAAKRSGLSPLKINRGFKKMARSEARLNLAEYVRNGLFHEDRLDHADRANFLSNDLHWPIAHRCNPPSWQSVAEDKLVAEILLRRGGVRTPQTLAVTDVSGRLYPDVDVLSTQDAFSAFLNAHDGAALFCKSAAGMVSFGAFSILSSDPTHVVCSNGKPYTHADLWAEMSAAGPYLIQRLEHNHPALEGYTSSLATVRMVNLVYPDRVEVPFAIIKLPQGQNIADAFWRPGNLACSVNLASGDVETIARRGVETEFLDDHPETSGLMGLRLPLWSELRALNEKAAKIFAPIRYQSTDIAITPDGPVIVELNYGGGFDLPQYASGRGFLTREVRAFFDDCGVKLAAKKSLFGL